MPPGRTGTAAAAGDGVWAGSRVHTFYGYLKVEAVVSDGALTDVRVPEYPSHDGTSRRINAVAIPHLVKSAVASGGAGVDAISGARLEHNRPIYLFITPPRRKLLLLSQQ